MNRLEEARVVINQVDHEMAALFEKRMQAVKQVIEYKVENNLPIYDAAREQEVIEKNLKNLSNSELEEFYKKYIIAVMDISKEYQNSIKQKSRTDK